MRVLIVDDDELSRKLLRKLVTRAGFSVVGTATDGHQLFRLLELCKPSLVVLDLDMNKLEGLSTLRRLSKGYPRLPVLMISLLDPRVYVARCMRLGARGFLNKGEGLSVLPQAITQIGQGHMVFPMFPKAADTRLDDLSERELLALLTLVRGGGSDAVAAIVGIGHARTEQLLGTLQAKLGFEFGESMIAFGRSMGLK